MSGERIFRADVAAGLADEMQQAIEAIIRQGRFASDGEQDEVLAVYREGIRVLRERIRSSQSGG